MSFWNRIKNTISGAATRQTDSHDVPVHAPRYCIVDVEVGVHDKKIHDIGAVRWDGAVYHSADKRKLMTFIKDAEFVCGHNIINHDARYLFGDGARPCQLVDTLYLSPLLFPEYPYHHLVKDDKLMCDQLNNPVNDCEKARDLLMAEKARWNALSAPKQKILAALLQGHKEFEGFLSFVKADAFLDMSLAKLIRAVYSAKIASIQI